MGIDLEDGVSSARATHRALADCLHELQQTLDRRLAALARSVTPETVHRSRTAARRLRALLHAFKRHLNSAAAVRYAELLKELAHELDGVREADVTRQTVSAVAKGRSTRENGRFAGLQALASEHRSRAVLDLHSTISGAPWTARLEKLRYVASDPFLIADSPTPMIAATRRVLMRRRRRLRKALRYRGQAPRALHKLRLKIKTIRYLIEACVPAGRGGVRAEVKRLRELQDCLGDLHDAWCVRRRLEDQSLHRREAVQLAARLKARQRARLRSFRKLRKSLLRTWSDADEAK